MDEIKNKIKEHVTILGNGKSLSNLSDNQINLINTTPIFRCNWFFLDNSQIKKNITAWFHNVPGGCNELLQKYNQSDRNVDNILAPLITDDHKKLLCNKHYEYINSWEISKQISIVAKKHLRPKKERGKLNLPTTGINMFHFTCLMKPKLIYVSGIDMYKQNSKENSDFSKYKYDNPYNMNCKPHDLKTDIMFIIDACLHIEYRSNIRIFHCPFFTKIIDIIFDELTPFQISRNKHNYDFIKNLANTIYLKVK